MLKYTSISRKYYKNYNNKHWSSPLRRWLYHFISAGVLAGGALYIGVNYYRAGAEARKYGDARGRCLCSPTALDFFTMLPLNRLSYLAGILASSSSSIVPLSVHQACIALLVWWYNVDLSECECDTFNSVAEFYSRRWKPCYRPVDQSAHTVAPCDGEVLAVYDNITDNKTLVQVKGCTYSLHSLLRTTPPLCAISTGKRRVGVLFRLRLCDYHHVIAPQTFHCESSIYVPGALLPVSGAAMHYFPGLLTQNERVIVQGSTTHDNSVSVNSNRIDSNDAVSNKGELCKIDRKNVLKKSMEVTQPSLLSIRRYVHHCLFRIFSLSTSGYRDHWNDISIGDKSSQNNISQHRSVYNHDRSDTKNIDDDDNHDNSKNNNGFFALALVGSTLQGKISLSFDERIRTNFLDPPEYAVRTSYGKSLVIPAGHMVGSFQWGSAVMLVVDVPSDAELTCRVGDIVKAGEALIVRTESQIARQT